MSEEIEVVTLDNGKDYMVTSEIVINNIKILKKCFFAFLVLGLLI